MPIKLLVTHSGDNAAPDEYVFDQETVMIGRDNANLLTLPDPARIVSKHHAEIRETSGGFELVDLGSKNFTYLNGKRLTSGQPVLLNPGDRFKIGEFEVQFFPEAATQPEENRTVFAADFANPFDEPAEKLAEVLGSLRRIYAGEDSTRRSHALRDALESAMIGGGDEPGVIVARLLGGDEALAEPAQAISPASPPRQPTPAQPPLQPPPPQSPAAQGTLDPFAQTSASAFAPFKPPANLPADLPPDLPPPAPSPQAPAYVPPTPVHAPPPAYAPPAGAASAGGEPVLDVLIEAVSKLAPIPWRFRHEFIGQTIVQSSESTAIHEKSPTELKAYLTDPQPDAEERQRRLTAVTEAADAVAVHQLAMLDGYKASVQQGAKRLLDEVDPAPIEAEVEASSPMYKVAQLRSKVVVERLKEVHHELGGEDWSVAERRAFRPAFIKAYLARMTRRKL